MMYVIEEYCLYLCWKIFVDFLVNNRPNNVFRLVAPPPPLFFGGVFCSQVVFGSGRTEMVVHGSGLCVASVHYRFAATSKPDADW